MELKHIIIIAIFQSLCALLGYGMTFAYFQRKFPSLADRDYEEDRFKGYFFGICCFFPFFIILVFILSAFARYGLKFK